MSDRNSERAASVAWLLDLARAAMATGDLAEASAYRRAASDLREGKHRVVVDPRPDQAARHATIAEVRANPPPVEVRRRAPQPIHSGDFCACGGPLVQTGSCRTCQWCAGGGSCG